MNEYVQLPLGFFLRYHNQSRLNVTAHPATAGGLANTSLKINIHKIKRYIVFYRVII